MKAGNDDLAADVDLAFAAVFAHRSDNAVVADRDVALDEFAADQIEDPPALQHHVGLGEALPLLDGARRKAMASLMRCPFEGSGKIPEALFQAC